MFTAHRLEQWLTVRRARVLGDPPTGDVLEGPGYLYRPEQLLVNTEDLPLIQDQLKQVGAREDEELAALLGEYRIPVTRLTVTSVPIPALVSRLRAVRDEGSPVPRVGPNHVFAGEPTYHGGPGGEPRPTSPVELPRPEADPGDAAVVAALDTGIPTELAALHPGLADRITTEGDDIDPLYDATGLLDLEAGHGTFVSGILRQLAPWVRIDPEKVLDSRGIGDDTSVTLGIAKAGCSLTNASLGGYTHDDMPPPALEAFLATQDPEWVLVAAAGNNGQRRPFWPAAFKHVIAVGAVDTRKGSPTPARFTNCGSWVDCCAPGVDIRSTYVKGRWRLHDTDVIVELDRWACWSGTSFAAPQVTAVIARRMRETGQTPRQAAYAVLAGATEYVPELGFFVKPAADLGCPDR